MVLNLKINHQKSTSSVLEFSTVETTLLFHVFFIAKVEARSIGEACMAWFIEVQLPG